MKKISIIACLIFSVFNAFAQSLKEDPDFVGATPKAKGFMIDTVSTSSLTKPQLFSNTLSFISSSTNDARKVIENKDLELGEITFSSTYRTSITISDTSKKGKITTHLEHPVFKFKCNVYLKDGKFKIVIKNILWDFVGFSEPIIPYDPNSYKGSPFSRHSESVSNALVSIIKDMTNKINSKPSNDF